PGALSFRNSSSISPNFVSMIARGVASAIADLRVDIKKKSDCSRAAPGKLPGLRAHALERAVHVVLEPAVGDVAEGQPRGVPLARLGEAQRAVEARFRRKEPAVAARGEGVEEALGLGGAALAIGGHRIRELRGGGIVLSGGEALGEHR